jgi:hypothetical protein
VLISIGEPIAVDERMEDYRQDRRGSVARLTADLQRSLEGLIVSTG